jgi:hypothetical protein
MAWMALGAVCSHRGPGRRSARSPIKRVSRQKDTPMTESCKDLETKRVGCDGVKV